MTSGLVFPAGVATAETLKDVFSHGREAARQVTALLGSLTGAIAVNAVDTLLWRIPRWAPSVAAERLTFSFDPSLLLLGFGGIIGLCAGIGFLLAATLVVVLQISFFDIHWTMALIAIPMSFVLATVAARVAGETGIPPIGAIGKVSQLSFGVMAPLQPITNLMTANVAEAQRGKAQTCSTTCAPATTWEPVRAGR